MAVQHRVALGLGWCAWRGYAHAIVLAAAALLSACAHSPPESGAHSTASTAVQPVTPQIVRSALSRQLEIIVDNRYPVYGHALPSQLVRDGYEARDYEPLWLDDGGSSPALDALIARLNRSARHGLIPEDYHASALQAFREQPGPGPREQAELDVLATIAALAYAQDVSSGRFDPELIDPNWQLDIAHDAWQQVALLSSGAEVLAALDELEPAHEAYRSLQYWYVYYRDQGKAGGDVLLGNGALLLNGSEGERVVRLRDRLRQLGDLSPAGRVSSPARFDDELERAVRRFQQRHGLTADGRVGSQTRAALNVPLSVRAEQLRINMERWRWMPARIEDNHIWVDLTDYRVDMHLNGRTRSMRAVIGRPDRPTRVFRGEMTYMEINPTWRVPQSVARDMLLPIAKVDPGYFARNNFRIYESWHASAPEVDPASVDWAGMAPEDLRYRIEQEPDPGNAMGQYKFMFPNRNAIYLHDTPERDDFIEPVRAYSAGCVRLHDPALFAETLLQGNDAKLDRLERARSQDTSRVIQLDQAVPIYLVYFTAQANGDEPPSFRSDIYQRDALMAQAMSEPSMYGQLAELAPNFTP